MYAIDTPYPIAVALMNLSFFLTLGLWLSMIVTPRPWRADLAGQEPS